jgi:hypothetical protein
VVWSDAATDKTVGCRKTVKEIYRDAATSLREQFFRGVESSRAGPEDGNPHSVR